MSDSNVVQFKDRRRPQLHARKPDEPRYWCMKCETDLFRNYADGKICCGNCGALIRNILVTQLI